MIHFDKAFLILSIAMWICFCNISCKSSSQSDVTDELTIYIGTNTNEENEGIYIFNFDQLTAKSSLLSKYTGILNPGYLTISENGKTLYAAHSQKGEPTGQISAFSIKPSQELQFLNQESTGGKGVCYVSTDPLSGHVLASNYSSGSTSLIPTNEDGSLQQVSSLIQHHGKSIDPERQTKAHAHYAEMGPGDLVYATDLGTDKIMLYQKYGDQLSLFEPAYIKSDLGAGPRHIAFHANQKFIYLLNEMAGSVTLFQFDRLNYSYTKLQSISSLAEGFDGYNKSADIHIHPSNRFLYASNRGDSNSLAVYEIDQSTGMLTLIEVENESVAWPRNFAISPNGKYLLCANRDDNSISVFDINQTTGALTFTGSKMNVAKPICIQFGKL